MKSGLMFTKWGDRIQRNSTLTAASPTPANQQQTHNACIADCAPAGSQVAVAMGRSGAASVGVIPFILSISIQWSSE
eukprot:gene4590-biopygen9608